jgi:hypothetical protein
MYWNRDPRYRAGGYWTCAVKRRAWDSARYHAIPLEERKRIAKAKYERLMSDPRRAFRKRVRELEVHHRKRLSELSTAVTEEAV